MKKSLALTALTAVAGASLAQVQLNVDDLVVVPTIAEPPLNLVDVRFDNFVAGPLSGTLASVVAKTPAFGDNLIFAWIVINDATSTANIGRVTVNGWTGWTAVVAQHSAQSLLGNPGKPVGTADRGVADTLGFNFAKTGVDKLVPGSNSTVFWALSDATEYTLSTAQIINGAVATVPTFAPVPEPATMVALGAGLAALAARRRRKS